MRLAYQDSIVYIIDGINPEPWTAPESSIGRKGGRFKINVFSHEQMKNYKDALREQIKRDGPLNFGDIDLEIDLYFYRQVAEYETALGNKGHAHVADATNLQKATEDALQGLLFDNDRQIRRIQAFLVEQGQTSSSKVIVRLSTWVHPSETTREFLEWCGDQGSLATGADSSSNILNRENIF